MGKGWIKLYRQLQECWIWKNKEPFDRRSAWVDLLLSAMHNDTKRLVDNEIIVIKRGSFMTSVVKLSERWGWSRGKTDRFLKLLENEQMLNTKRTPLGTLVTIVKYEDFQGLESSNSTTVDTTHDTTNGPTDDTADGQPMIQQTDSQRTADDTAVGTHNKNIKNIKNDKNLENEKNGEEYTPPISPSQGAEDEPKPKSKKKVYYPNDEMLDEAFKEFLIMRNKIKKPLATQKALTRMMNRLEKLSGGDNDLAIKILNQSTDHCWQDVYELKGDDSNGCTRRNDTADKGRDAYAEEFERMLNGE